MKKILLLAIATLMVCSIALTGCNGTDGELFQPSSSAETTQASTTEPSTSDSNLPEGGETTASTEQTTESNPTTEQTTESTLTTTGNFSVGAVDTTPGYGGLIRP